MDARDAAARLRVIEMTSAAALVTNPPYGGDHHRIAEAFLSLLHGGCIRCRSAGAAPVRCRWAAQPAVSGSALCAAHRDAVAARLDRGDEGWRDDLLDMVGLDFGTAAERITRHCVGQEEAVCEHPNRTGDYNRACLSALGQMVGQSLAYLRKTQITHWLRREVWRSSAPQHYRRSPEPQVDVPVFPAGYSRSLRVLQVYSSLCFFALIEDT